jgi:hypothetical protein
LVAWDECDRFSVGCYGNESETGKGIATMVRTRTAWVRVGAIAFAAIAGGLISQVQASSINFFSVVNTPDFSTFGAPADSAFIPTTSGQPVLGTNEYTGPGSILAGSSPAFSASGITSGSDPAGSVTYTFNNSNAVAGAQTYAFAVTLNNTTATDIHRLGFQLTNNTLSTAQFNQLSLSLTQVSPARFDNGSGGLVHGTAIPTGPLYIVNADEILFDPFLAAGSSATYEFSLSIPAGLTSGGKFNFTVFAAAPEPTSLLLGAIGVVATGGVGFMRRRKQEVTPSAA